MVASKKLQNAASLPALETAWKDLAKISASTSANTNERNRLTREAHILAARCLAADETDPETIVARWRTMAEGDTPWTDAQRADAKGTYRKMVSQFRAIRDAAKANLEKLIECWPSGEKKADDGTVTYGVTLNRQQFVDIAVKLNRGEGGNQTGAELAKAERDAAKAKAASKNVMAKPEKAAIGDLAMALHKLCLTFAVNYSDKDGSEDALALAKKLKALIPTPEKEAA